MQNALAAKSSLPISLNKLGMVLCLRRELKLSSTSDVPSGLAIQAEPPQVHFWIPLSKVCRQPIEQADGIAVWATVVSGQTQGSDRRN